MSVWRLVGIASAVAVVLLSAACGGGSANALAPRSYLDRALSLMQEKAAAGGGVDWVAVDRRAREIATGAKTPAQTYPAIKYALSQLQRAGDGHAVFIDASAAKAGGVQAIARAPFHALPTVALKGRIGEVTLPGFEMLFGSTWARRYLGRTLARIATVERRHPCGWILDLDDDVGGNGWAMVLSVGPIIGDGRVFGLTGRKGFIGWARYHAGVMSGLGNSFRAPLRLATITPAPPVAVLIGAETASGGELAAVAFRGRPNTRSFGTQTYGATNGPQSFRLADGAQLVFGVNYFVDRSGRVYRHAIQPDVTTYLDHAAATRWLLHTPACSKRHQ